jgi:hypothetical protein
MKKPLLRRTTVFVLVIIGLLTSCKKDEPKVSLIYQADFDVDNGTWFKFCQSGEYCCKHTQGKYEIAVDKLNYFAYAFAPCGPIDSPYYMSVDCTIRTTDNTKIGYAGLIYNYVDDNNYKIFFIASDGKYRIFKKVSGTLSGLNGWTSSPAIKIGPQVVNTLKLDQHPNTIEFFVNGTSLNVFQNGEGANFRVGLIVGSALASDVGSFDNLVINKIK